MNSHEANIRDWFKIPSPGPSGCENGIRRRSLENPLEVVPLRKGYARAMSQYQLHGVYVMQQDGIVCNRRLQRIDVDPDFSNQQDSD